MSKPSEFKQEESPSNPNPVTETERRFHTAFQNHPLRPADIHFHQNGAAIEITTPDGMPAILIRGDVCKKSQEAAVIPTEKHYSTVRDAATNVTPKATVNIPQITEDFGSGALTIIGPTKCEITLPL